MISVSKVDDRTFEVTVSDGQTTTHRVTVDPSYHQYLTGGKGTAEELVEKSFDFLLEREPNTSILPSFDLSVIAQYFPEYEERIAGLLD